MTFNSQICTTREQSERLLSLGLKKETADMMYEGKLLGEIARIMPHETEMNHFKLWDSIIPAWSLHRLIVLNLDTDLPSAYEGIEGQKNIYDEVIDYTEWLIKEGYFNKEYLEE